MYFNEAELQGWKTGSGLAAADVQLFKTTNAIDSSSIDDGTYPTSTTIDSTYASGNNLVVVSSFTNGFSGVGAGGGGGSGPGPLPVEMLSFEGKRNYAQVDLEWRTASELNNSHFDVLRSVNGSPFEPIGKVMGMGTSQVINAYTFVDASGVVSTQATLCYQLRQVDFDGTSALSSIVCFNPSALNPRLNIVPNPVRDALVITPIGIIAEPYQVQVTALDGRQIWRGSGQLDAPMRLDLSNQPDGIYMVAIRQNGAIVRVQKVVKARD